MKARMLTGNLYIADDSQLVADSRRAAILTQRFNTSDPANFKAHGAIFHELFGTLGEGVVIRPPLRCDYGYQTRIGARTFINYGAILLDVATLIKLAQMFSF